MAIELHDEYIRSAIESTLGPGIQSIDEAAALKVARTIVQDILEEQANETRQKEERRKRIHAAVNGVSSIDVSIPRIAPGNPTEVANEIIASQRRHGAAVEAHEARIRQNGQRVLALVGTIGAAAVSGGSSIAITAAVTELAGIVLAYAGEEAGA